jgi:hypothetical protein
MRICGRITGIILLLALAVSCANEVIRTAPLPVNSLRAESGPEQVVLSWSNPADTSAVASVSVSWKDPSGTEDSETSTALVRSITVDGLTSGVTYTFSVWLTDKNGIDSAEVEIQAVPSRRAAILYVKADAGGKGTGSSWTDAYTSLEDALDNAYVPGDQIWVAAGTYTPEAWTTGGGSRAITTNDRFRHFFLRPGVTVYGGFTGAETSVDERDWTVNRTVLSGDFDGNDADNDGDGYIDEDTMAENAVHVIYIPESLVLDGTAVLDGFYISGGNANEAGHDSGGGIHVCGSSPTFRNCVVSANSAAVRGGGAFLCDSAARFEFCVFDGNSAGFNGGGLSVLRSGTGSVVEDSLFYRNTAGSWGGGISIEDANLSMSNSTVVLNDVTGTAPRGAGIMTSGTGYTDGTTPGVRLSECILWGNTFSSSQGPCFEIDTVDDIIPVCNYCIIRNEDGGSPDGAFTGTGNSAEDPGFTLDDGDGPDDTWFSSDDGIWCL